MPGIITSIIGGVQGASASHNAGNEAAGGQNAAGATVTNAAQTVNPTLAAAGQAAGTGVTTAAGTAATNATSAANAANAGLSPYQATGSQAESELQAGLAPGGSLTTSIDAANLQNTPGYQFQMQQGQQALARSAAATSGALGGGAAKAAIQYGQGLAGTEYQQAYEDNLQTQAQQYGMLSGTAGQGLQASALAGGNTINAAQYGGNINTGAAQYAGNANIQETNLAGANTMNAAVYKGNTQIGAGNDQAAGTLGAANAWNGMLSGIGNGAQSALSGGFGGSGGGFNLGGAVTGNPNVSWIP